MSRALMEERHGGYDGSHICAVERRPLSQYRREPSRCFEQWPPEPRNRAGSHRIAQGIREACTEHIPELLAATQAGRSLANVPVPTDLAAVTNLLRRAELYPLFAKPVAGKYSLSVLGADAYDRDADEVILLGGERRAVCDVAASIIGGACFLLQRRLNQEPQLAALLGPWLWSVRVLVFLRRSGPTIHRAVAKTATGANPADNYWRTGNMLGAIELTSGIIQRVVRGAAADLAVNEPHPPMPAGPSSAGQSPPGHSGSSS
jgi:hypothetical protein